MIKVVPPIDWQKKYGVSEEKAKAIAEELNRQEFMFIVENRLNDYINDEVEGYEKITAEKVTLADIERTAELFADYLDNDEAWDAHLNNALNQLSEKLNK